MARSRGGRRRSRRSRRGGSLPVYVGRLLAAFLVAVLVGTVLTHVTGLDQDSVRMLAALAAGVSLGRGWPR